jgi:hypothetical protein
VIWKLWRLIAFATAQVVDGISVAAGETDHCNPMVGTLRDCSVAVGIIQGVENNYEPAPELASCIRVGTTGISTLLAVPGVQPRAKPPSEPAPIRAQAQMPILQTVLRAESEAVPAPQLQSELQSETGDATIETGGATTVELTYTKYEPLGFRLGAESDSAPAWLDYVQPGGATAILCRSHGFQLQVNSHMFRGHCAVHLDCVE